MFLAIVQVPLVILTARAMGGVSQMLRQPRVIGEMAAGILLGPSFFGWIAPDLSVALFHNTRLDTLNTLSQIGLLLFMFLVGLEMNPALLSRKRRAAIVISWTGMAIPLALGAFSAIWLHPRLAPPGVPFVAFALFMGSTMSVTAFPVLARILMELDLLQTRLGTLTVVCAAVDDVSAWCLLALVVIVTHVGSAGVPLWVMVTGCVLFVALMLGPVRSALSRFEQSAAPGRQLSEHVLMLVALMTLASAWITELLGLQALFGAFLAGAILPKSQRFVQALTDKLHHVTVLLLPLYFAFTGLRTSIGLLGDGEAWAYCVLVILVAIGGKFGGTAVAARSTGASWREAATIGILMNTRGLVELVILNVGLDIGVVSPPLFTMLVLMALVTTFMASPLLRCVCPLPLKRQESVAGRTSQPLEGWLSDVHQPLRYPR